MAYESENVQILEGIQHCRLRPSMYVGNTSKGGLHHLLSEIIDNSVDEAMAGFCDEINVVLFADGETISVLDNGRGIPVSIHPQKKISTLEVVLTVLNSGAKFDSNAYASAGGLHGVGASCVNALSDYLKAEVWRDGGYWAQEFSCGKPKHSIKKIRNQNSSDPKNGTKITFHADREIFKEGVRFDEISILRRLRETAFLNKSLKLTFRNEATGHEEIFHSEGGVADYVKYLTEARTGMYPAAPIYGEYKADFTTRTGSMQVEIAMNYAAEDDETIMSFANGINTVDGGTHLSGFKTSYTRIVNQFARSIGMVKEKDNNLSGDDIREGMTAIINVRLSQPEFVGQTKDKLGTTEAETVASNAVTEIFTDFFNKNPAIIKKIVERAVIAAEARDAAKKQSALIKRKSLLGGTHRLPGKLSDCNSSKMEICELFIVEGNSAGGSCKDGRDSETQAVLPLRGKIINAEKNAIESLLKNQEIQSIILAIGAGFRESFEVENRRYNKVILCADADDDGCHITSLLIAFFCRFMRPLLDGGYIYLARPPLFRIDHGKNKHYCHTEIELQDYLKKISEKSKVVRFKGLGEMDAEELGATTMNKQNRQLIQLTMKDAGEAEHMLSVLMGSNVAARKLHIASRINNLFG